MWAGEALGGGGKVKERGICKVRVKVRNSRSHNLATTSLLTSLCGGRGGGWMGGWRAMSDFMPRGYRIFGEVEI